MASSAGQNTSKILTLNAGSSSLKFKIYEFVSQSLNPLAWGVCERVGEPKESTFKVGSLLVFFFARGRGHIKEWFCVGVLQGWE